MNGRPGWHRNAILGVGTVLGLLAFLWCYDAWGYRATVRFESDHAGNPQAVLERWQSYQTWHPTRHLLRPGQSTMETEALSTWSERARLSQFSAQLATIRNRVEDPDADAEETWQHFQEFRAAFGEIENSELLALRDRVKARRDAVLNRKAQKAVDQLCRLEREGTELSLLVAHAEQIINDYGDSSLTDSVREKRTAYLIRIEEKDIEAARGYSTRQPFSFQTRKEHYQHYLDRHPAGQFAAEARQALTTIDSDWDKHDFSQIRDLLSKSPGATPELVSRCRTYLTVHPKGQFTTAAHEVIRWTDRVTSPGEYRVVLRSGDFEHRLARYMSRGPDLSVEIEVGGVRYGPSTIVKNRYDPDWDYEFPRRIRWKLGDEVKIRVSDHDYWKRLMLEFDSAPGDPLAIQLLSGEIYAGNNRMVFESDFRMPVMPAID